MAQEKEQTTYENPYLGYAETATHTVRELWGWQVKTAQSLVDQGLRTTHTLADFTQTQVQEAARLTQDLMKMGLENTEALKKSFAAINEKIHATQK